MQQSEDTKLEVQFSAIKSYVIREISALVQKIEQISESLNNLKQNDNRNTDMLKNNISFLKQELRSKDELIKSLMDPQIMVFETISKQNQFKRLDENLRNVLQHHHISQVHQKKKKVHHASHHKQRNMQEQHFNLEQKPQSPSNSTT